MNNRIVAIIALIFACFLSAFSQFLLKKASQREYKFFWAQYLNFRVIFAYSVFFAVILLNTFILRFLPLAVVSPIAETLPFILSIFVGHIFFNESINIRKIVGTIIIVFGIIIIAI